MLATCAVGLALTAAVGHQSHYWWFVAIFALGRPLLSATSGVAQVTAAEQTASSQRAKAVALIAAGYGIGSGLIAIVHSLGGGTLGFRGVVLLALVPLAGLPFISRWVVEPDRFKSPPPQSEHPLPVLGAVGPLFRRRVADRPRADLRPLGRDRAGQQLLLPLRAERPSLLGYDDGAPRRVRRAHRPCRAAARALPRRQRGASLAAAGAMVAMALFGMVTYSGRGLGAAVGYLLAVLAASVFAPAAGALTQRALPDIGPSIGHRLGRSLPVSSAPRRAAQPSGPWPTSATVSGLPRWWCSRRRSRPPPSSRLLPETRHKEPEELWSTGN